MLTPFDALAPLDALKQLDGDFEAAFSGCATELALRTEAARYVGGEGLLTKVLKRMPEIPGPERKPFGQAANALKTKIESALNHHLERLRLAKRKAELEGPGLDVSLPGRNVRAGRPHPIHATAEELLSVFSSLGFRIAESREIELPEYNFGRLGFPPDHPATDMQDSFFVDTEVPMLLRTHATAIQVHEMLKAKPPMAVVTAGTVYRRDDDATHSPMFHQVDGFCVDRGLTFADLKGVLSAFVRRMFGDDVPTRFRPSYFPFVEPGGELDMGCVFCRAWQSGGDARKLQCRVCKTTGWMEVLGCGMIHPTVFNSCGVDPAEWSGFAWGMGIDRIAMLRYGISDIRMLYENDMRFLEQV